MRYKMYTKLMEPEVKAFYVDIGWFEVKGDDTHLYLEET